MNPWWRLNLALGVVAALLLVALLWPHGSEAPDGERLSPSAPDEIAEIRIERDQRLALAFERHGERWHLTHPRKGPAQTRRVGQLLAIAGAPLQRRLPGDVPLADYGLAAPTAVIQFDRSRIAFGERDPSRRQRYVHIDDEVVGLVDDLYFNLLGLPPSHYLED
jgi:hypothetical protein